MIKLTITRLFLNIVVATSVIYGAPTINSQYYFGQRFGFTSVGQRIDLYINKNISINTDFESIIDQFSGTFFSPNQIYYGTGIQYKNFGFMHYCMHNLDKEGTTYPIRNKFYIQW